MSSYGGALGIGSASEEVEEATIRDIKRASIDGDGKPSISEPSETAEKGELYQINERTEEDDELIMLSHEEQFPIDPTAPEEKHQFTVRAVFVGCCLGGVIAASKYVNRCIRVVSITC